MRFSKLLHVVKLPVIAVAFEQFVVRSAFHYPPFVQHVYLVGVLDGRQAMGYGYCGARFHETFEGFLHKALAFGVECRSGLVENEYVGIL